LLSEARTEKDKLTTSSVKARLKEIGKDPNYDDEAALLREVVALFARKSTLETQRKEAQAKLNEQVFAKYQVLGEEEVKTLVVDDKWLASLTTEIGGELDRVSQALATRLSQLANRYAIPLSELTRHANELSAR